MKPKLHIYTLIAILLCALLPSRLSAQPATGEASAHDSLRISLLTCTAGEEIYTLFGHTAIRCENLTRKTDVVYNYGVFDFSSGGFVLRFALGETDYRLDKSRTDYFTYAYYYYGRDIRQQVLNLTQAEKERLVALLEENYRPENRVYRYNFFYDNCSTRPRDKVEEATEGTVDYGTDMEAPTRWITARIWRLPPPIPSANLFTAIAKAIRGRAWRWTSAWEAKPTSPSAGGRCSSCPSCCKPT